MSDTAAFFAKKKKGSKKKTFKSFNANKIDVSAVSSSTHVDAPAVSTDATDLGGVGSTLASTSISADASNQDGANAQGGGEQWDDEALASKLVRPVATVGGGGATELLDMKALDAKRREQDDIAERLRVEETKAQLAKAKEGMEKEAQRMKEEQDAKKKSQHDAAIGKPRFGDAAKAVGSAGPGVGRSGGKWVPPHMRGSAGVGLSSRQGIGMSSSMSSSSTPGSTFQRKVDMQDEDLFPDLASAEAIITQQQEQEKAMKARPKKSRQGGAAWGGAKRAEPRKSPTPAELPEPAPAKEPETKEEPKEPEPKEQNAVASDKADAAPAAPAPAPPAKSTTVPSAGAGLKKKKKKKKDLSTFKASS